MSALTLLTPALALASGGDEHGGGSSGGDTMLQNVLILLSVVVVAYFVTHIFLERLQKRFGVTTGVEYIILGAFVGPILGFMDENTLAGFTPAMVLGTGSLGLLAGMHLNVRQFGREDHEGVRIALWISVVTLTAVALLPIGALYFFSTTQNLLRWMPGLLCIGSIALVADPRPLQGLLDFLSTRGDSSDMAVRVAHLCSSFAVVNFGLVFCMFEHTSFLGPREYGMIEWFVIHLLLGGSLGLLFRTFLRSEGGDERILTVVIGMVIFTSGIAYYLRLSPIFVNFILGFVLINTSEEATLVERRLASIERPLYIVLFFFAGSLMNFSAPWWAYTIVVPYVILRSTGRLTGGLLAMRTSSMEPRTPALGRVLFAPGALSVAMLIDFHEVFRNAVTEPAIYNGMITAVIFSEMLSYMRTRSWLIDYTDVPPSTIKQVLGGSGQQEG